MDLFYLKVAECNKVWGARTAYSSPGYTSGQMITVGGIKADGTAVDAADRVLLIKALAKDGKSPDDFLAIAQIRLDSEDYAGAKEYVLKSREGKPNAKLQRQGELILGNAAYATEEWSEAADRFLPLFNAKGPNDHAQTVRTVQALFAANRRAEAKPLVEWLSQEKGGRYKASRAQFTRLLKDEY